MSNRRSPRGSGKTVQQPDQTNEDCDESSECDPRSPLAGNRSRTSVNDSFLNISARSDLGHHSDANVSSNSETYQRKTTFNTSTSSNSDDLDGTANINTSKSPAKIYPSLEEFKRCETVEDRSKIKKHFEDKSSNNCAKEQTQMDPSTTFVLLVASLIISLILAYIFLVPSPSKPDEISTLPPFDRFVGHVDNLQQHLPSQNNRLWKTVKASTMHVLKDASSNYPVVILMAATTDRMHVSRCIAKKIASSFDLASGLNPQVADIRDFQHLDSAAQKQMLDEKLNLAFTKDQRKSFIIDNLQLLHPKAALLLHGYCDGDNAPHKDVMMVLLLHINENDVTDYNTASVENYLEQQWSTGLELDKVKALLSRVANNIVTIEAETDADLAKACQ